VAAPAAADPTIVVHAGGVRAANGTIGPLPNGAIFTATEVGNTAVTDTCTTSGGTGTCDIAVPTGFEWDVTETTPPPGYYLNPNLDSGTSSVETTHPYTFRTTTLTGATTTVDVPGPATMPNGTFTSQPIPPAAAQTFSQQLATSVNDPPGVASCGLNLALVLDQSGSMAGTKQTNLKAAANEAITDLTGTPSNVAIYTFAATTGVSIAKTSTINATSAAPLHTFINALPTPANGTNWDQGLAQVPTTGFDEVIFLTDGAPTGSRIRTNDFGVSEFTDTEQGIFSANGIKAGGERIVAVGIGLNGGLDNLRAVSGPTLNQDYFNQSNSDFGTVLQMLATGACNNQLTITKQIESPSGALITPTPADADGWAFTNTISSGTIASSVSTALVNGANGVAPAAVTIDAGATPTVTATETPGRAGYTFEGAQCSVGGTNVTTSVVGTTASFTGAAAQPMACTFTNRRSAATIATTATPAGGPVGTSISDTATVSGGVTPTGNVTFHLFAPGDTTCTTSVFSSTNPLSGSSATSGTFPTTAVGTYHWTATYNGDTNNAAVTSGCTAEPVVIAQAAPTIATTPSAGGPVGTSITDTATVSGGSNPTGTVTFHLYPPTSPDCSGTSAFTSTNPLSGAPLRATSGSFSTTTVGTYHWVATYNGDTNNAAVTSACTAEPVAISMGTPTTATAIMNAAGNTPVTGPLPAGSSVFDTATVSGVAGVTPTGMLTYTFFTNGTCTAPGGPPATVTLNANGTVPNSATHGPLAAGSYSFQAVYGGDANYTGSISPCEPLTIAQATATIATTATPTSGPVGTSISDSATVSGGFTPTGNVTFHLYAPGDTTCTTAVFTASGRPLTGGSATSGAFATTAVGTFHWTATYNGDTNNTAVTSGCTAEPVVITQATPTIATTATPTGGPVGTSVSDSATVSGGFTPTGNVTFHLYAPGDTTCTTAVFTSPGHALSGGSATSGAFSTTLVGTYHWTATYNGDTNNTTVTSACTAEPVVIAQATPTILTTPSAGGPVGQVIGDIAILSGGHTPTGTVTFDLFAPGDATCTGTPVFTAANRPLTGDTALAGPFPTTAVGTYQWVATYNGDTNNTTVTSACTAEPVVITQAVPTIATTPSAGGPVGTSITDTATVSGGFTPTGNVTFHLYPPSSPTCTGDPAFSSTNALSTGSATSGTFATTAVGTYHWTATYNGDTNNTTATSLCADEPVVIAQATPTIATTPSAGGPVGTSITDTATVSGGHIPTGTVTFHLYPPTSPTCTGDPAFSSTNALSGSSATSGAFATTAVGTYHWTAVYSGDTNNTTATSLCADEPVVITQATPTIATTATPTGGPVGTSVSDSATVSGGFTPTGNVTFHLYAPGDTTCTTAVFTSPGHALSGGSATSGAFSTTLVGTYHWTATYNGDTNNTTVTSACTAEPVVIAQATPTILTTPSAGGPVGQVIGDIAILSGGHTPTGTVTFDLFAPGDATCTGTPVFTAANRPLTGDTALAGPFPTTAVGTYQWVATYNGDTNNTTVTSACTAEPVVITQAVPTIATTPSAGGPVGTSITDTATVSGGFTPTGNVTFHLYPPSSPTCTGDPAFSSTNALSTGSATSGTFATTAVGTYHWTATYNGDTNNTTATSLCADEPVVIAQATPTIATTPSAGGPVGTSITDTATVSGGHIPTGTVTFHLYPPTSPTCTGDPAFSSTNALSGSSATSGAFATTAVGTYHWTAVYSGDTNNTTATSLCADEPVVITQATPTIATTATPTSGPVGTSVSDSATVSGGHTPTGTVTFHLYPPTSPTCTGDPAFSSTNPLSAGSATSGAFSTTLVGTYHWTATYSGDTNNTSVTSLCADEPVVIAQAVPTIATTPSAGGEDGTSISDMATVSGGFNPTGDVTFDLFAPGDTTCTGTPVFTSTNPLTAGSATSDPFPTVVVGTYEWVATYSGDANNTTATSVCGDESVIIGQATTSVTTQVNMAGTTTAVTSPIPLGTSVYDTAAITHAHAITPTGTVTYLFYSNGDCTGDGTGAGTVTLDENGTVPNSDTQGPLAAGSYSFQAAYSGDADFVGSTSPCEPFTISMGTPTTATVIMNAAGNTPVTGPLPAGSSVFDTATVSGVTGVTPTGTLTYTLFTNGNCTPPGGPPATVTLNANGTVPNSGTHGPLAAGSYSFQALYGGDANYTGSTSACEPLTIAQVTPTIATTPSAGGEDGTSITDTATVSGGFNPTGDVTFDLFAPGDTTCTGTPVFTSTNPLTAGSATSDPFPTVVVGTYEWVATYSGDANNTGVPSLCGDESVIIGQATTSLATQVNMAGTTTAVTSPIPLGSSVYDTATITHAHTITPTGTVTYTLYGTGDCTGSGTGAGTVTLDENGTVPNSGTQGPLAAGSHSFEAAYSGDADFISSTSPCEPFTVNKGSSNTSTTVFNAATNAAWAGTELTGTKAYDTATVSHSDGITATGTVTYTFYSSGNCSGTSTNAGTVTLTSSGTVPNSDTQGPLLAGSHSFQAVYSGDTNYSSSTSSCEPFSVDPAPPAGPAPIPPVIVPAGPAPITPVFVPVTG
jgi:Bacterial Ig-like domain (group 3)